MNWMTSSYSLAAVHVEGCFIAPIDPIVTLTLLGQAISLYDYMRAKARQKIIAASSCDSIGICLDLCMYVMLIQVFQTRSGRINYNSSKISFI